MNQIVCGANNCKLRRGAGGGEVEGLSINLGLVKHSILTETDFFKKTELLIIIPDDLDIW